MLGEVSAHRFNGHANPGKPGVYFDPPKTFNLLVYDVTIFTIEIISFSIPPMLFYLI